MINTDMIMMSIINKNLSYKDRQSVISTMESVVGGRNMVYGNIGNYFYKRLTKLNVLSMLGGYTSCKGDVTKFKGYENNLSALQFLKADTHLGISKNALIVEEALLNLKSRKKVFELGFKTKETMLGKLAFGAVLKACVAAISMLITESSVVSTSKSPFTHMVFDSLALFNMGCKDGTVDKMMRYELNLNGAVKENAITDLISVGVSVASALITGIRSLVYWVYYTRIELADYLEQQAAYIEINKVALENRKDIDANKKKEIIRKQTEWQKTLLDLSDKIQLDDVKAARKAKAESEKDAKEIKAADANGTKTTGDSNGEGSSDNEVPDFF